MFSLASILLLQHVSAGTPPTCSSPVLSCHNTTIQSNTCCFNSPGGQFTQTQFWDASPATGPSNSWTIHGLWPDHCDGTYDSNCDASRAYTGIGSILTAFGEQSTLDYMNTYWKDINGDDETFWEHEWSKHGTCISTLKPSCYTGYQTHEEAADFFKVTVDLFKTLPSYTWLANAGIVPSNTATYTSSAIQNALISARGHPVTIQCSNGALDEIWYHYDVLGSVQTGQFVAADPVGTSSNCPATGIKYLPKAGSGTATTSSVGTTPTGSGFSGSGYLNVYTGGSKSGCLISAGTWFASGTCATITATASGSGFTLSSSKGKCAIVSNAFTCASSVTTATVFTANSGKLVNAGTTNFYASAVAAGQTQQTVYSTSHAVTIQIEWQAI